MTHAFSMYTTTLKTTLKAPGIQGIIQLGPKTGLAPVVERLQQTAKMQFTPAKDLVFKVLGFFYNLIS